MSVTLRLARDQEAWRVLRTSRTPLEPTNLKMPRLCDPEPQESGHKFPLLMVHSQLVSPLVSARLKCVLEPWQKWSSLWSTGQMAVCSVSATPSWVSENFTSSCCLMDSPSLHPFFCIVLRWRGRCFPAVLNWIIMNNHFCFWNVDVHPKWIPRHLVKP